MIETQRLLLKPLTYDQLISYMRADGSLETELNLIPAPRIISPELKEALEETILPNVADPGKNYLFSTLWTIILQADKRMIGDLCFMGEPDAAGEIEIGYGTYEDFRNHGFMAEAVGGIIQWALKEPGIKGIVASTEKANIASYTVLEKNKFVKTGETETLYNWRLQTR